MDDNLAQDADLMPCPFCALEEAVLLALPALQIEPDRHVTYAFVQCLVCYATGPRFDDEEGDDPEAAARDAWNQRAAPAPSNDSAASATLALLNLYVEALARLGPEAGLTTLTAFAQEALGFSAVSIEAQLGNQAPLDWLFSEFARQVQARPDGFERGDTWRRSLLAQHVLKYSGES